MLSDLCGELLRSEQQQTDRRPVIVETHLSWVILASDVYKLKKPVKLPFVDFTTLAERERACRTEAQINLRLAPRTYRGVVPVRRTESGRFSFEGSGPIVEWAVKMRRLDDARRADVLLEKHALTLAHVDALARRIAEFHAQSSVDPLVSSFGAPEVVERNVVDNFDGLRSCADAVIGEDRLAELESWQKGVLNSERALFGKRMRSGAVRDGHGDLRLEHVFFGTAPDDFEVIDAIEFSDRFRFADVCADVAFLAMDLARFGRIDLAERFAFSYARAANDFELYRLLDFYASYRACVRAKVACLRAAAATSSEEAMAEARRYLLVAEAERTRRTEDPNVIVVAGGIATGKSTISERLGEQLSLPVIDADRTRKYMLGLGPTVHAASAGAWQGGYDPKFSVRVYRELIQRADAVLASGRSVVLDASFRTKEARALARELARKHGARFHLFECVAPLDVCRARLATRDRATNVSDATPAVLDDFAARYEPITELSPGEHVRIDTSASVEDALARVRASVEVPLADAHAL